MHNIYFYNSSIRSIIVGFGQLFQNYKIVRKDENSKQIASIDVPIAYGNKEKWLTRINTDPELSKNVMNTLPRMAFSMVGLQYDAERKLNMNNRLSFSGVNENTRNTIVTPVPYNIEMRLDIMAKNNNDALQIVEQILPYFTPHYNITIKPLPNTDINQDVPIILNSVQMDDTYNQDWSQERYILYSLMFTIKTVIYGGFGSNSVIKSVTTDIISNGIYDQYNAYIDPMSATKDDDYDIVENWYDKTNIDTIFG